MLESWMVNLTSTTQFLPAPKKAKIRNPKQARGGRIVFHVQERNESQPFKIHFKGNPATDR